MPRARKQLVCLSNTPYYHITSRCVRRAFLCGVDQNSGNSYEHRQGWIEDRLRVLSSLFTVHLCAYAVMSNHYHLVVKLCPDEAREWSADEVLKRWTSMFRGPLLVQRFVAGEALSRAELDTLGDLVSVYRKRLNSLSWFMKCLNEPIARKANAEDGCTGHFWEARFHSQPLVSERALFTAMAYVDLNPIRSRTAKTPEQSRHTSIRTRIRGDRRTPIRKATSRLLASNEMRHFKAPIRPLLPFTSPFNKTKAEAIANALPMEERDYLVLVDITGRAVRGIKSGKIDNRLAPILERLRLSLDQWTEASTDFRRCHRRGDLRLQHIA